MIPLVERKPPTRIEKGDGDVRAVGRNVDM